MSKRILSTSCALAIFTAIIFVYWVLNGFHPLKTDGPGRIERSDETEVQVIARPDRESAPDLERGVWIRGVVLDASGRPLKAGSVTVFRLNERGESIAEERKLLEEPGVFRFRVDAGHDYSLEVDSETWGKASLEKQRVTEDLDMRITYEALSKIEGKLTGTEERLKRFARGGRLFIESPAAEANLAAAPPKLPVEEFNREQLTFSHGGLGPGSYRIVGAYWEGPIEAAFKIPRNGDVVQMTIELVNAEVQEFVGKAVLEGALEPLARTRIYGRIYNHGTSSSISTEIVTGDDGMFSFSTKMITAGSILRFFRGEDAPYVEVTYGQPGPDGLYLLMFPDPPTRYAVVMNRDGEKIPHVQVVFRRLGGVPIRRYWKRSDGEGRFTITELETGNYEVKVLTGSREHRIKEPVAIEPQDEAKEIVIAADIGRFLVLKVEAPGGASIVAYSACLVQRHPSGEPAMVPIRIPGGGIVDLERADEYSYRISDDLPASGDVELHVLAVDGQKVIALTEGWLRENNFLKVTLENPPREMEVEVLGPGGAPVDDAEFAIPFHTEAALAEGKPGLSSEVPEHLEYLIRSPWLGVRKLEAPGRYRLNVFPGEGSLLRVASPSLGAMVIPGDRVIADPRLLFKD